MFTRRSHCCRRRFETSSSSAIMIQLVCPGFSTLRDGNHCPLQAAGPVGSTLTMNSGRGDYETLSNIISRYPGEICRDPVDIEARTLSGLTPSEVGDAIYRSAGISGRTSTLLVVCFVACPLQLPRIMPSPQLDLQIQTCLSLFMHALLQPRLHRPLIAPYSLLNKLVQPRRSHWELLGDLTPTYPGKICDSPQYMEVVTADSLT